MLAADYDAIFRARPQAEVNFLYEKNNLDSSNVSRRTKQSILKHLKDNKVQIRRIQMQPSSQSPTLNVDTGQHNSSVASLHSNSTELLIQLNGRLVRARERFKATNRQLRVEIQKLNKAIKSLRSSLESSEAQRANAEQLSSNIYTTWNSLNNNIETAVELKVGASLTDVQFTHVRNELTMQFDEASGRFRRILIPGSVSKLHPRGLHVPPIPNVKRVRHRGKNYADDLGMIDCIDGRGAFIDSKFALAYACKEAGLSSDGKYHVQIIGDAHRALKTFQLVNICVRGFHSGSYFNALSTMNRVAILEGKDVYSNENLRAVYAGLNMHVRRGKVGVTLANNFEEYPIEFFCGGDMAYHAEVMGLGNKFSSQSGSHCLWCECEVGDLSLLPGQRLDDGTYYAGAPTRTLKSMFWHAHLSAPHHARGIDEPEYPFTCPKCGVTFDSKELCARDIEIHMSDTKEQKDDYERVHCSVSRGKRMLVEMDPMKFVGCVLHLLLSVVSTLWEASVCVHLQGPTAKKRTDDLNELLKTLQIHARAHVGWKSATGRHEPNGKFNGTEAQIALANWGRLVDIVLPPTKDGKYCEENLLSKSLAHEWIALYNVLQSRVTARDPAVSASSLRLEPTCSCCGVEFSPVELPSDYVPPMPARLGAILDPETRLLRREYRRLCGKKNMCASCNDLTWRRQKAIRAERKKDIKEKALAEKETPLFTNEELRIRRLEKAAKVREMGSAFCANIKKIIPAKHTYYLHALPWHFPQWIEELEVDIMDASGSGIEQINQETKRAVLNHTNNHVKASSNINRHIPSRTRQTLTFCLASKRMRSERLRRASHVPTRNGFSSTGSASVLRCVKPRELKRARGRCTRFIKVLDE